MRPVSETESKAVEQEILRQKLMTNVSANAKEHLHKCIKKGMKRGIAKGSGQGTHKMTMGRHRTQKDGGRNKGPNTSPSRARGYV